MSHYGNRLEISGWPPPDRLLKTVLDSFKPGWRLRFNDLIATVLAGRTDGAKSRVILWRQCIDLLAQFDGNADADELNRVSQTLEMLRGNVGVDQKVAALRELGTRLRSPRLVRVLLKDETPVQVAVMNGARLDDGEWPDIVAEAGPLARSVLRRRKDIGPETRRALDAFGLSDLALVDLGASRDALSQLAHDPVPPLTLTTIAPDVDVEPGQDQIRRIVDRIERFTSARQGRMERPDFAQSVTDDGEEQEADEAHSYFTYLTDADGVIRTVHGVPRALLAGLRLASPSMDRSIGPDGQILGAFRRRGTFRDGRLTISDGPLAGCWLVDGDPLFDQRSGRFTGYRGAARRASDKDVAPVVAPQPVAAGDVQTSASLRQLIHELRTPLTGVMGFAELIETQLLGPVSDRYRNMAGEIITDVRGLVDILDDIDLAHRNDGQVAPPAPQGADAGALLASAIARLGQDEAGRERILPVISADLPRVNVAPTIAERMMMHFVRALAGCVGGETLGARGHLDGDRLVLEIDRPHAMACLTDAELFDAGFEHVAMTRDTPVLGVGFALRLVRRLAQANGGCFTVHSGHFALKLPVVAGGRAGRTVHS